MAADLGKNTTRNHYDQLENRIKTMSLCDNVPWITAVSNDISYDEVFVEQLKSFATEGDLVIVFSGSGNSTNIVKTVLWAKDHNIHSIGILGFDGGYAKDFLELSLIVKSSNYGVIESVHSCIHHYIVEVLKRKKKEQKE
jgi:D-sedoheptulose 7-phosphate isomerase